MKDSLRPAVAAAKYPLQTEGFRIKWGRSVRSAFTKFPRVLLRVTDGGSPATADVSLLVAIST